MKRALALFLGLTSALLAPLPASALDVPQSGRADSRVRWVNYNEWEVFRIVGTMRSAQQVVFADDEEVLNVALGDTIGWEVAPSRNVLFLKPREPHPPTNMLVSTVRGNGEVRNYTFELHTREGGMAAGSDTYFQVKFNYPTDEANARRAQAAEAAERREAYFTDRQLAEDSFYGPRNYAYSAQGSASLQPSHVWDNGKITHLRFPENMAVPSIFVVNADGSEATAEYDTRGEYVVIHQVAREIRLRRGGEVICIYNERYSPYGIDPGTNTVSPSVVRVPQRGAE